MMTQAGVFWGREKKQVSKEILKDFLLSKFGNTGPEEWRKLLD